MEIQELIIKTLDNVNKEAFQTQFGTVISVFNGLAKCVGLRDVSMEEVVLFENEVKGITMSCDEYFVTVLILGDQKTIETGEQVRRTGEKLKTKIYSLKSVIDGFGNQISGQATEEEGFVWKEPPEIIDTALLDKQLITGIKSIDWLTPISWGQRALIIGDRFTGKTTLCKDIMINLKDNQNTITVYVSIGQNINNAPSVIECLKNFGVENYIVVVANNSDPAAMRYLAPMIAMAQCEYWQNKGYNVAVFFDDLNQQAEAYREISLVMKRPPGREAYPGDVFYLHAHLLERAHKNKNAAISAFPIIETNYGDISSYLATNVISITDGQIVLSTDLFNSNHKPAIKVSHSVTRVGIQEPWIKKYVQDLKLQLAQWEDIKELIKLATDIDDDTREIIERGHTIIETLSQNEYEPVSLDKQILILYVLVVLGKKITPFIYEQIENFDFTDMTEANLEFFKNNLEILS